jgi:hypothetical protein
MPDTFTPDDEAVTYLWDVSDVDPRVRPVYLAYLAARDAYIDACAIGSTDRAIRAVNVRAARRTWAQAFEDATGARFPLPLYGRNG